MKALILCILACVSTAWTQTAPLLAGEKGETVIAIFDDGTKMTVDEFRALVPTLPEKLQQMAQQDAERFFRNYAVIRSAAVLAQGKKLDEKSPYKETLAGILAFTRMYTMADFAVKDGVNSITIDHAEIEKYYNEHKEVFKQIKVSGLKVAFGGTAAPDNSATPPLASMAPKKILTEEEAKAKAAKLAAQVRGGADFAKLVLLETDDETSKAKGGDLGTWRVTDNVPQDLRTAVLGLNEGEVSEPVRQAGGFYLVHADAVTYTPLKEVEDSIFQQLKQDHAQQWMQNLEKNTKVEYLGKKGQPPPPAGPSKPGK